MYDPTIPQLVALGIVGAFIIALIEIRAKYFGWKAKSEYWREMFYREQQLRFLDSERRRKPSVPKDLS